MIDTKAVRALADEMDAIGFGDVCDMLRQCADEIDALRSALDKYGDGQDWVQRAMQAEAERDTLRAEKALAE